MHLPDGFLSPPVWAALDAGALAGVVLLSRKAQRESAVAQAPLLGVMGAFVFAAQMINFPVGVGASGHLVGAALLAYTVGPAAASIVMTAILAIQALLFQDGGILALGANVANLALAGVWAAWLPFALWGAGRGRRAAIVLGGFLSVFVSAGLMLAELLASGVTLPRPALLIALAAFALTALAEGVITLAVLEALERLNHGWVRRPAPPRGALLAGSAAFSALLALGGFVLASAAPDGLEHLAELAGFAARAEALLASPFPGYETAGLAHPWLGKTLAGAAGLLLTAALCLLAGRMLRRGRRA